MGMIEDCANTGVMARLANSMRGNTLVIRLRGSLFLVGRRGICRLRVHFRRYDTSRTNRPSPCTRHSCVFPLSMIPCVFLAGVRMVEMTAGVLCEGALITRWMDCFTAATKGRDGSSGVL